MKHAVRQVAATCLSTALTDEPWQIIGFSRRPKYGAFFQRFRSTWRVDIENKMLKELVIAFTAAHVLAGVITPDDITEIVALYTSRGDVVRSMGYISKQDATEHMTASIRQYLGSSPAQWDTLLFQRLDPPSLPNSKMSARLIVGCVQFGQNLQNIVMGLNRAT
jgi:hypothetical protein